jgi:hypothetical protein
MITMITMAPVLINMGCSSGVWGLRSRPPGFRRRGGTCRDDTGYGWVTPAGAEASAGTSAAWSAGGSGCAAGAWLASASGCGGADRRAYRRSNKLGPRRPGSVSLGAVSLGAVSLGAVPLGAVPLGAVPLGAVPLGPGVLAV